MRIKVDQMGHHYTTNSSLNRLNRRPSHPLLPGHAHVPGTFLPEDTVLSPVRVTTGSCRPRTRSSPRMDLPALLAEVSRPVDRPVV